MTTTLEKQVRNDFPVLDSLGYALFPDQYRDEEIKYRKALQKAKTVSQDIIPRYVFDVKPEKVSLKDRFLNWMKESQPKTVLQGLCFVTFIFFLLVVSVIVIALLI